MFTSRELSVGSQLQIHFACLFPTLHWKVLNKSRKETNPPSQIKKKKNNTRPNEGNHTTVKEKAVMKYLSVEEK